MTNEERNKETVRAYARAFSEGDWEAIQKLFTPDAAIQGVLGKGGLDVALPVWRDLHDSLAVRLTVDAIATEGDQVAVRLTESGEFRKDFRGKVATGKTYAIVAMEWFRMRDGLIAERWGARDSATLWRLLGAE